MSAIISRLASGFLGIALLACIASPAAGFTTYPPGPSGTCPDTLTIRDVYDSVATCHPAIRDTVWGVRGIITAVDPKPSAYGLFIQNTFASGPRPWTGLFILTGLTNYNAGPYNLALGDSVAVYGTVQAFAGAIEIEGPDQIQSTNDLVIRRINSGNALPPVHVGTTADFNWVPSVSRTTATPWEGCLVSIGGPLRVARTQTGAGVLPNTFLIVNPNAPADSVLVDGVTFTTMAVPILGSTINSVQGVLVERNQYRIQVRGESDISIAPPTPQNATATAQCGTISVNWDVAPGASGYRVKRDGVVISGPTQIAGPPFIDASPGIVQHCYSVCAVLADTIDGDCTPTSCTLAPDVAPTVTDPSNRTSAVGGTVGLSVFSTGLALTHVWRKDGVPIPGAPNLRTLTLTNVQVGDAGSYDVYVCNACGCDTSATATLAVCPTLTISPLPSLVRVVEGAASAQISTSVSGASSMHWYRSGVSLAEGAKYSGTATPTLTVSNVASADGGFYELRAFGICGPMKRSNTCELRVAPCTTTLTVGTQPSDQNVPLGSPATFSIFVTSCATPMYQWQHYASAKWNSIAGATGSEYTIASVTAAHTGNYRCIVWIPGAPAGASRTVALNMLVPRILTMTTQPVTCASARVNWTTSVPMTVVVAYGTACGSLTEVTPPSALATSGFAVISLANRSSAIFRLSAQTAENQSVQSPCAPAYFLNTPASLRVQVVGLPSYGDLYGTDDGIPIRLRLSNSGCAGIVGPIVLTNLRANNKPPRRPDQSSDVPRDLSVTGLGAGQSLDIDDLMFSRTEVGAPPGATIAVSGTIRYGTPPRSVPVSGRIRLP